MKLRGDDVRAAYYVAADVVRSRQRTGQPIPEWLHRHFHLLDNEIRKSQSGRQSSCGDEVLEKETLIAAAEASTILDVSKRQVLRLAADLGGELVCGRWLFKLSAVQEYAEGRHHD